MKQTPLERRTPLRRKKRMRARSPRRIARETPVEKIHKRVIRLMTFCDAWEYITGIDACDGVPQASHLGTGGMGQKRGDWTCTTMLCKHHHDELDGRTRINRLGKMSKPEKRMYRAAAIVRARLFVERNQ